MDNLHNAVGPIPPFMALISGMTEFREISPSHLQIVRLLLENNHIDVNDTDNIGQTVLIIAALNNHIDLMNLLFEFNADMDAKMKDGTTAIKAAVSGVHTEAIKLLLAKGAEVNFTINQSGGFSILQSVIYSHPSKENLDILLDKAREQLNIESFRIMWSQLLTWSIQKVDGEMAKHLCKPSVHQQSTDVMEQAWRTALVDTIAADNQTYDRCNGVSRDRVGLLLSIGLEHLDEEKVSSTFQNLECDYNKITTKETKKKLVELFNQHPGNQAANPAVVPDMETKQPFIWS